MRDPRVRQAPTMGRDTPRESIASSTLAGGRYVWHNRAIRTVMMLVLIPSLLGQPYTSLLPVFARDVLDIGPTGQGVLLGAVGIGAFVGAVVVATLGNTRRQGTIMLAAALVFGLTVFGFGASLWFGVSVLLMALSGVSNVSYGTQANTILQSHTTAAMRGRVMGLYFLNRGLAPLGSLLAGALAAVLGAPRTVEVMGLSCALIVLWVWFAAPEVRELQY